MFEVGKKVIAITTHPDGYFKSGNVFELLAIKKACKCYSSGFLLLIDLDLPNHKRTGCFTCGYLDKFGESWFMSFSFVPYDDSLSELTDADIIYSEETIKTEI